MSNEHDNQPEVTESAPGTAPEAEKPETQERTFTAKEVEAIVRDRLARVKKEPKTEPKAQPTNGETRPADDIAVMKERFAFEDALDELTDGVDWKPSKKDKVLLRAMFKAGGSEQMAALAERLRETGKGPESPAAPVAAQVPGKPYVPPPGSPNSPSDVTEQNPANWSRSYIERLQKDGTFRQEVEKFYKSGQGGPFRRSIPKVS